MPVLQIPPAQDSHDGNGESTGLTYVCSTALYLNAGMVATKKYLTTYMKFLLDNLPSDASISQVRIRLNVRSVGGSAGLWTVRGYGLPSGQPDPELDTGNNCELRYTRCCVEGTSGNKYLENITEFRTFGEKWLILGGNVAQDIMNAKSGVNRFTLAVHEQGQDDQYAQFYDYTSGSAYWEILEITYTVEAAVGYSYSNGLVSISVLALMRNAILSVCGRGLMEKWVE